MRIIAILLGLVLALGRTSPTVPVASSPEEVWDLHLPEAIRRGLENSEPVTRFMIGATEIPLGGFEPAETWELDLRDAIRIGLENSPIVRVTSTPGPVGGLKIEPVEHEGSIWAFQSDLMAHVRSIEQQYWALWQQQATIRAREAAVRQGEVVVKRERAEVEEVVCRRSQVAADLAEAEDHLEKFQHDLAAARSDLATIERQFRNILGLPMADPRRMVAVTSPIEAKVEPDRTSSLRQMAGSQPDIARQKVVVRLAEMQLVLARNQLLPRFTRDEIAGILALGPLIGQDSMVMRGTDFPAVIANTAARMADDSRSSAGFLSEQIGLWSCPNVAAIGRSPLANTRQAQYHLLRQRSALQAITNRSTEQMDRSLSMVESGHERFMQARRQKSLTAKRHQAMQAYYDEGRITIDRLLDAIGEESRAVIEEAEALACYNTALAALGESKGTILAEDGVELAGLPDPVKGAVDLAAGIFCLPLPPGEGWAKGPGPTNDRR